MLKTDIGRLRLIAIIEGISYLVLLGIAMPLKYLAGQPAAVKITGSVHGFLFVAFCFLLLHTAMSVGWSFKRIVIVFISSVIPFGTFVMDKSLKEEDEKRRASSEEH